MFITFFIYIRDNKNLGLNYYDEMKDSPLSDLLIQASIKTENELMVFSDYSWQDCPDTGRSTGAFNNIYQDGPIDHRKKNPGPVSKSSSENEYKSAWNVKIF